MMAGLGRSGRIDMRPATTKATSAATAIGAARAKRPRMPAAACGTRAETQAPAVATTTTIATAALPRPTPSTLVTSRASIKSAGSSATQIAARNIQTAGAGESWRTGCTTLQFQPRPSTAAITAATAAMTSQRAASRPRSSRPIPATRPVTMPSRAMLCPANKARVRSQRSSTPAEERRPCRSVRLIASSASVIAPATSMSAPTGARAPDSSVPTAPGSRQGPAGRPGTSATPTPRSGTSVAHDRGRRTIGLLAADAGSGPGMLAPDSSTSLCSSDCLGSMGGAPADRGAERRPRAGASVAQTSRASSAKSVASARSNPSGAPMPTSFATAATGSSAAYGTVRWPPAKSGSYGGKAGLRNTASHCARCSSSPAPPGLAARRRIAKPSSKKAA